MIIRETTPAVTGVQPSDQRRRHGDFSSQAPGRRFGCFADARVKPDGDAVVGNNDILRDSLLRMTDRACSNTQYRPLDLLASRRPTRLAKPRFRPSGDLLAGECKARIFWCGVGVPFVPCQN